MIFKSNDGKFYQNPVWVGKKFVVQMHNDFLVLFYIGHPTWEWARRCLPKLGISARLVATLPEADMVVDEKLVGCVPFVLWPLKEIGTPHSYDSVLSECSGDDVWKYDPRLKFNDVG